MQAARVLLLEDDPMVRRFAAMALEDLPVALVECASVAQALAALREAPVRLVITDLMLPGESGLVLLQHLRDDPALRADARLVVYSAGVRPRMHDELRDLGVHTVLLKPVSLKELRDCVGDALPGAGAAPPPASGEVVRQQPQADPGSDEAQAIELYFAGNGELFHTYRATCVKQFPLDLQAAEQAIEAQDLPALGRLAHSLKTVLRTLGHVAASDCALEVERHALRGEREAVLRSWPALRAALKQFR